MNPKAIRRLSIPQPCSENWSAMARSESGERFCASCQHAVFDLTTRSDAEVLRLAAARDGRLCGRITTAQLDRINRGLAVRVRPIAAPSWPTTLLLLIGLSLAAPAATFARPPLAVQTHLVADLNPAAAPADTVVVEGYVLNATTGAGLGNAWVRVVQTGTNQHTDSTGYYRLEVPIRPEIQTLTLHVEHPTRVLKDDTLAVLPMQSRLRHDIQLQPMLIVDEVIVEAERSPGVNTDFTTGVLCIQVNSDEVHDRAWQDDKYWQTLMWRRMRPSLQPFEPDSGD